jgi:small neutral amino acid transporter SnatA (MarC family)
MYVIDDLTFVVLQLLGLIGLAIAIVIFITISQGRESKLDDSILKRCCVSGGIVAALALTVFEYFANLIGLSIASLTLATALFNHVVLSSRHAN